MKAIIKLKFTDDLLIKSLTHVAEYIMRGAYLFGAEGPPPSGGG